MTVAYGKEKSCHYRRWYQSLSRAASWSEGSAATHPHGLHWNTLFRSAESGRDRPELSLGRAFDADAKDGETFGKLSRYETAIERSLFRSLHEIRQIQEKRHNCTPATRGPEGSRCKNKQRIGALA
jgi:hypothetical protein